MDQPSDQEIKAVSEAIRESSHNGREGPYGLYDYTGYEAPKPHRVRDFRNPHSKTWGSVVFSSDDRDEAKAVYDLLTESHVAISVIRALDDLRAISGTRQSPDHI